MSPVEKLLAEHEPNRVIRGCKCGLRQIARPLPDPGEFEAAWAVHLAEVLRGDEVVERVAEAIGRGLMEAAPARASAYELARAAVAVIFGSPA